MRDDFPTPSVDVERRLALPDEARRAFDEWMIAEGLWNKRVVYLRHLSGNRVEVDFLVRGIDGKIRLNAARTAPLIDTAVFPVSTEPPAEALSWPT